MLYLSSLIVGKLSLLILGFGVLSCKSHLKIPQNVSTAFWAKYENATNIEWSSTEEIYTVSFDLMEHPKLATFKTDGEWIRTISVFPPERAMVCLKDFVDENYGEATIEKVVLIETSISEKYFVTIGTDQGHEKKGSQNEDERETDNLNQEVGDPPENIVLEFYSNCEFLTEKHNDF